MPSELIAISTEAKLVGPSAATVPALIAGSGAAACFAWEEFIEAEVGNQHTRRAYRRAVTRFCHFCTAHGIQNLQQITPGLVGRYFQQDNRSVPTKKLDLAALRRFFDILVSRHAIMLNPAASVRGERYHVIEGKTPEITKKQARSLLASIDTCNVVGLRDRAIIATLIYTAARVGAIARLRRSDLRHDADQWVFRFHEKGGKSRAIPLRHDLQQFLLAYLDAAGGLTESPGDAPVFRSAMRKTKRLSDCVMTAHDMRRMLKRRLKRAGLPARLSCHSFRTATVTDLLEQGLPLPDVQELAGHADPRTTRLYDRRQRRVTRNVVERISI